MSKTLALATSIQILRNSNAVFLDETLVRQMINLGIRKIHDVAISHRGNGKYKGHRAWSKSALSLLETNNGSVIGITKYLSHEHVVPLKIVVDKIFIMPKDTSIQEYVDIINEWGVVAIITREEDLLFRVFKLSKCMPESWDGNDYFARYRAVGLFEELVF
ncbi:MAG: hypothetical protein MJK15_18370 [Colwellia sp.]|nr:hypothetical protein [Colwellia sp.]